MTLVIGQFDRGADAEGVKQRAAVTMAWAEAKAVCHLMLTNIAFYESYNGRIQMPKGMTPDPLNLPDTENNPRLMALNERLLKIRELMFGEE